MKQYLLVLMFALIFSQGCVAMHVHGPRVHKVCDSHNLGEPCELSPTKTGRCKPLTVETVRGERAVVAGCVLSK